jgi:ATP-dependent DNA helicase RecG
VRYIPPPPVSILKGVGPRVATKLEKLGIRTVQDLLFHLPSRYQDRTRIYAIASLRPGQEAVVEAEVIHADVVLHRRRMLLIDVRDDSGGLTLRFFHFGIPLQQLLRQGATVRCFGEVRQGFNGLEMVHPELHVVSKNTPQSVEQHLTPIYPTTEGMHQISLRKLSDLAIRWLRDSKHQLIDWLPTACLTEAVHYTLDEALLYIHRPPANADVCMLEEGRHPARLRLAFEELVAQQLSLIRLRLQARKQSAPLLKGSGALFHKLESMLPFTLTGAQQRVIQQIVDDISSAHPMQRLVQGDVGSGKTIVAAAASLYAVEAGYQVAIMAPTELLAEQHYRNFAQWLTPLNISLAWLSGKLKGEARKTTLTKLASGEAAVVIGTHALVQQGVIFKNLALVVIDEQHRFGVHQRLILRDKGLKGDCYPHQLIMTATPIPRTLAMTAYADLDHCELDEMPPGRIPVKTVAIANSRRDDVIARVSKACEKGHQAYWVCTLIEESDVLQCQAAEEAAESLKQVLPNLEIGLAHGRMRLKDKEAVMQRFRDGKLDLLVSTTVIEVGVDIPNASLMIIENAERLGLAQLHQLRGRVGRGTVASSCVLMYQPPLSDIARRRLQALREKTNGFEIAEIDLHLRGPGELMGTRQTGMIRFRIADIMRDRHLIPKVQQAAKQLIDHHPQNVEPLIERWLGDSTPYAQV